MYSVGIANCSINIHLLLHLPYYVHNLGPLWCHSAFGFENCMQEFLKHSHATQRIEKQVYSYIAIIKAQTNYNIRIFRLIFVLGSSNIHNSQRTNYSLQVEILGTL